MKTVIILICTLCLIQCSFKLLTREFSTVNFEDNDGWEINENIQQCISKCVISYFGAIKSNGRDSQIKKSFQSTVDHDYLLIKFQLWALAQYNVNQINLFVDNQKIDYQIESIGVPIPAKQNQQYPEDDLPEDGIVEQADLSCLDEQPWPKYSVNIVAKVPHSKKNFQVKIRSEVTQENSKFNWSIREFKILAHYRGLKCHPSCNCDQGTTDNSNCTECVDPNSTMVDNRFCECKFSQGFITQTQNPFKCYKINATQVNNLNKCDIDLNRFIQTVEIISYCSLYTNNDQQIVRNQVRYDWSLSKVPVPDACKNSLRTQVLVNTQGDGYLPLSQGYVTLSGNTVSDIMIPLIDVYELASVNKINGDQIYQVLNLAIELGNQSQMIRQHQFTITVYTDRYQVNLFQLDTTPQYSDFCQIDIECVVSINMGTETIMCEDQNCQTQKSANKAVVGQSTYVLTRFKDPTYKRALILQRALVKTATQVLDITTLVTATPVKTNRRLRNLGFSTIQTYQYTTSGSSITLFEYSTGSISDDGFRNLQDEFNQQTYVKSYINVEVYNTEQELLESYGTPKKAQQDVQNFIQQLNFNYIMTITFLTLYLLF